MKIWAMTGYATMLWILLVAAGCSKGSDEPPKDYVFKGYENALDKAKQVQSQLDEAERKRRKQMEEMTR
jgi:tRNA A-37 threonylcarbamoyl transferase component Bud32